MFCEITELRRNGMRLRPDEWDEPQRGRLAIEHWQGSGNNLRRTIRQASLWDTTTTALRQLRHMRDPVWIDVVGDAFLMSGTVAQCVGGRIYDHEQVWLVRPLHRADSQLPVFNHAAWSNRLPES